MGTVCWSEVIAPYRRGEYSPEHQGKTQPGGLEGIGVLNPVLDPFSSPLSKKKNHFSK